MIIYNKSLKLIRIILTITTIYCTGQVFKKHASYIEFFFSN
jgi:hypothetical protein